MACNFALMEVPAAGPRPLAFPFKTAQSALSNGNFVGFSSISMPELTIETREVKEGNWPYVHQLLTGHQSGGTMVFSQAVLSPATDMYLWWKQALKGIFAPRRDLLVTHTRLDPSLPNRILHCQNCIPVGWSPASDFDAMSSTVSMESMSIHVERIDIIPRPLEGGFS